MLDIIISNSSELPIYEQIEEQIKGHILKGTLAGGEALPSVRILARELRISVITTRRAYEELERDGYIETCAGRGSFVKGIPPQKLGEARQRELERLLRPTVAAARKAGASLEELIETAGKIYGESEDGKRD